MSDVRQQANEASLQGRPDISSQTVAAASLGDPKSQRNIYESCARATYSLVLRLVGRSDAEDVLQQVFLKAFSHLGRFSGDSRFETWLFRITVNECLQHLRRKRRNRLASLELDPMDPAADHERSHDEAELLERALGRLDPVLRSLFLLREKEKLSYHELSVTLGIPVGTVASRLNQARTLLKQHLKDLGWEE